MALTINSALSDCRHISAWLCLCPLLVVATSWSLASTFAICLFATIMLTACVLVGMRRFVPLALKLPLAALLAGTLVVLEHLALAAWWPALDAAVAPWLVLVAGLVVLVCCAPDDALRSDVREHEADFDIAYTIKLGSKLSVVLLLIGVARDLFGRVFLLADMPIGALVLLALLLALFNMLIPSPQPSPPSKAMGEREHVL